MNNLTPNQILQSIFDNGRVTSESTQDILENEFTFEAREQGLTDEEIKAAINSDWFPRQKL